MKNLLLIVTLPAVLAACAAAPQSATAPGDSPARVATAEDSLQQGENASRKVNAKAGEQATEDSLPSLELTEDLMFKLLSSEIAYQRGDWQSGYVTMLAMAQQTRDPRIARRAAEMALAAKRADEALTAVRLWRTLAPHSDEAIQYNLSFIILGDNLSEAKPILEERLREARPHTRGLMAFQIQRLLSRAKDKSAAFALLEDVLAPYGDLPEAHLALAQSAIGRGDVERARKEAQLALKVRPDSELAILTLAQASTDKSDATKLLADFLARYPKSREVRVAYARMLVDQQQYKKARAEFETLLKDQPQDLTTLFALGILSAQVNDMPAAEKYLTAYLETLSAQPDEERDPTQALLILAQIAEERKDPATALKWLAQIEPGEGYFSAQIKRAQLNAKRGDLASARKLLHEINASGEREQSQVVIAEAQMLRDANRLPEAMTVLQAGVKRFPNNTDLLYDYAMLAEKRNQLDVMEASLRKIIELAPNNQHAYNALGYSFAERNIRLDEAYALIEKALKLAPDDPFIMDSMGWVQFRLGRLKEAEALLQRAYELRPDAEIAVHLGEVLWVKGQKADAQKLWRDAQIKDPQNDTLKSTLARLNVQL
ncbi:tetratricopeptide repeat protein [Noviherbaspirillum cavernae]|uniref:tetratricopeptide repeat protein n=1 Tax=Noviherbaspirillum cavernae TaxID=2320862 RepID=UPI001F5B5279|nr:tetratricopeptide repeat protein [Noviherbaspirillum cavernae]